MPRQEFLEVSWSDILYNKVLSALGLHAPLLSPGSFCWCQLCDTSCLDVGKSEEWIRSWQQCLEHPVAFLNDNVTVTQGDSFCPSTRSGCAYAPLKKAEINPSYKAIH